MTGLHSLCPVSEIRRLLRYRGRRDCAGGSMMKRYIQSVGCPSGAAISFAGGVQRA